jgi:hypothetical protein
MVPFLQGVPHVSPGQIHFTLDKWTEELSQPFSDGVISGVFEEVVQWKTKHVEAEKVPASQVYGPLSCGQQ